MHTRTLNRLWATALLLAVAPAALAQNAPTKKKLYCWDEKGVRVCGDALPATAVDRARTEFNARGRPTANVGRALSDSERAEAEARAAAEQQAADAEAARLRRELAMVESYASEDELRRAYANRVELNKGSVETAQMSVSGLRQSLIGLLRRAGESELAGKSVPRPLADKIRGQHAELLRQQSVLAQLRDEGGRIQKELDQALARYRELKAPASEPLASGSG